MKYYLAGYYLIQTQPLNYGCFLGKEILNCSTCINLSLLDNFSWSWTCKEEDIIKVQSNFNIDLEIVRRIQDWTEQKDTEGKIGLYDVFNTLETAKEYFERFFSHLDKVKLLGLYLPEPETDRLKEEFKNENTYYEGIIKNVIKKEPEPDTGSELGFDLIGIDIGGGLHTFHCHCMAGYLEEEFKVEVNELGLINSDAKWQELSAYMNDENSAVEPVPWYFAKVKLFE